MKVVIEAKSALSSSNKNVVTTPVAIVAKPPDISIAVVIAVFNGVKRKNNKSTALVCQYQ
jgi:hypothetical protein